MNQLQVFSFEEISIRVSVDSGGNPWLIAKDVCEVLGISKHRDAISRLRGSVTRPVLLDGQEMTALSEPGLYQLILKSRKPNAEKFQDWVTNDVLPSIRKTGGYFSKSLTLDERLDLALEIARDHRIKFQAIKTEIQEIKEIAVQATSRNSALTGFMTIRGFCNIHKITLSLQESKRIGKMCSSLSRSLGASIYKTDDEMFGMVNSYPIGLLKEVFDQEYFAKLQKPKMQNNHIPEIFS